MDPEMILRIAELAIGIAKNATSGKANTILSDVQSFEEIARHVGQQYKALTGQPIDTALLTYEEPIP